MKEAIVNCLCPRMSVRQRLVEYSSKNKFDGPFFRSSYSRKISPNLSRYVEIVIIGIYMG